MTSPVNLRFQWPVSATPGQVDLRFGDAVAQPDVVTGNLAAGIPAAGAPDLALAAVGTVRVLAGAALSATLPAPVLPLSFEASETVPRTLGALAATLPAVTTSLSAVVTGHTLDRAELTAVLPVATLPEVTLASAVVDYDQALPDAIGPGLGARAQQGARLTPTPLAAGQQQFAPASTPAATPHTSAGPLRVGAAIDQQQMLAASRASAQRWQHGIPLEGGSSARHADTLRQRRAVGARHQHGLPLGQGARSEHQDRIRFQHPLRADQQHGARIRAAVTARGQQARKTATPLRAPHTHAAKLPVGWWQATYPWPEPPIDPNAPSSPVAIRFCRLADGTTALIFGCPPPAPPGGIIVPIRRAYIVLNTITLVRASDGAPLSALSLSLNIDADSWTWGWDASIPGTELALVEPAAGGDPVELLATVNGQQFRLLAERIARDRRFAQSRIRISGRGRAAMLADPHSPIVTRSNAEARTMQQLLADALTINNVGIGWAVDWQAADWLVPAGLYNHAGSYIAHAQRLAEAAGAYVQADPLLDTLRILPRYPLLPWEWSAATPDITLPSAPVVREAIEWQDKAAYNRVFVSGTESGGVLGQITRAGTAGDVVAPMVTDPLITHADAARARGRPVLADTGRQARITLELPILPETGIITPGKLVQYTDAGTTRRGLVRSTAVTAQLPTARQTIELETHA